MLRIHFLNVGHGDCTIIEEPCGGLTVIDINRVQTPSSKETDPLDYLRELCDSRVDANRVRDFAYLREPRRAKIINRFILTHPDMDHMRGIASLLESGYKINEFWDTNHNKVIKEFRTEADKKDWLYYDSLRQGDFKNLVYILVRDDAHTFYWPNGRVSILSPTIHSIRRANLTSNHNNHSYVLYIEHCGFKVILGGDAEREVWEEIALTYGSSLKCHVLKASHHGRDSGYSIEALRCMLPATVILSVGRKPENDAHQKYRRLVRNVWSTRYWGTMVLEINAQGVGSWKFPDRSKQNRIEQILRPLPPPFARG